MEVVGKEPEIRYKHPEIRYKHVEAVLSRIFRVPTEDQGAFRARLRHLRNMGIPNLPKPGSGSQIGYTREQLVQMIIALELSALGIPPRHAAHLTEMALLAEPKAQDIRGTSSPHSREACVEPLERLQFFGEKLPIAGATGKRIAMSALLDWRDRRESQILHEILRDKKQVFLIVYPGAEFAPGGRYNFEIKLLNRSEVAKEVASSSRISFANLTTSLEVLDDYLNGLQ